MKRLFIGIPIESDIAAKEAGIWRNDRLLNQNRMNWVSKENWHVTLYFLGNTEESGIELLQQLIRQSFSSFQAFRTHLNGVGVFPHEQNPKVLWAGLENLENLMPNYTKLGDLLAAFGFPFDSKPLKPHLTLARIKSLSHRDSFEAFIKQYQSFRFGAVTIDRVVLFESISTPNGPVYKPLFTKWMTMDW